LVREVLPDAVANADGTFLQLQTPIAMPFT
jgi:hypothetical protein